MSNKTERVAGRFEIIREGSSLVGCMSWETPYLVLQVEGRLYRWQGDKIEDVRQTLTKSGSIEFRHRAGRVWRVYRINGIEIFRPRQQRHGSGSEYRVTPR